MSYNIECCLVLNVTMNMMKIILKLVKENQRNAGGVEMKNQSSINRITKIL